MASTRALHGGIELESPRIPGRRFFSGLTAYWNAIIEGKAAAHAYEELIRRGTPHSEAVARVLDEHFTRQ